MKNSNNAISINMIFITGLVIVVMAQVFLRYWHLPDLAAGTIMGIGIGIEILGVTRMKKMQRP